MISERFDKKIAACSQSDPFKLGILGGTFDPVHFGHLHIANCALEQYALDGVLFIPTGIPVRKVDLGYTSGKHRLAALKLAIASNPRFDLSSIELDRDGDTYTIDTVEALVARYQKKAKLFFIAGADVASDMHTWKSAVQISTMVTVLCAERAIDNKISNEIDSVTIGRSGDDSFGYTLGGDKLSGSKRKTLDERNKASIEVGFNIEYIETLNLDISSAQLRQMVAAGQSLRYLVPTEAFDYIEINKLYR